MSVNTRLPNVNCWEVFLLSKKRQGLRVSAELNGIFDAEKKVSSHRADFSVEKALEIVTKQMVVEGLRPRTISDYETYVNDFIAKTGVKYMKDVNADAIYEWLSLMNVQPQTKLIRIKCLRAFLERCFDNMWFVERFWRNITIHVDTPIKEGATEAEVFALLRILDLSDYIQLRDAASVLLIFETGLRLSTMTNLQEQHVDLDAKMLRLDGSIMKNRRTLLLPFSERLARILHALIEQNRIIRKEKSKRNYYIFITQQGDKIASSQSSNNISKRLNMYKRRYGLENINAHALRRGFAKDIYKKSHGDLALVSKALGHQDFGVTTRYLHLENEEVANELRKFRT